MSTLGAILTDWIAPSVAVAATLAGAVLWWTGRPKVRITVVEDDGDDGLVFDVENVGRRATSFDRRVRTTFWFFVQLRPRYGRALYDVKEADRTLRSFETRRFTAIPRRPLPPTYAFSWFRSYKLRKTGALFPSVARVESALLEPRNRAVFAWSVLRMLAFGRLPETGPMSLSDYEALRRSRGLF